MSAELAEQEIQSPEVVLKRVRHELGQAHGFDVDEVGHTLEGYRATAIAQGEFDIPRDQLNREATAKLEKWGGKEALSEGVAERYNVHAQASLRKAAPGEPVQLMKPISKYTNPGPGEIHSAALVRRMAIEDAAMGEGIPLQVTVPTYEDAPKSPHPVPEPLQHYLDSATINVYNAPNSSDQVITERVIDLPGMRLHEMNVHAVGSPDIIDAQVVAIKK